jgi:hypothetical protein
MTAAYEAATSNVTPRATKLLMEEERAVDLPRLLPLRDRRADGAADRCLRARRRAIFFALIVAVIGRIVVSLLLWIDHLTRLGRVGETTDRVEETARGVGRAAARTLPRRGSAARRRAAALGPSRSGRRRSAMSSRHAGVVAARRGARRRDPPCGPPSTFVHPGRTLAWVTGGLGAGGEGGTGAELRRAFTLGAERSFD